MADLFSPMKFDEAQCKVKAAGTGDAIDPKHIAVDPSADNIITNDPQTGLKVVAEDFISAEEGNIAKKSLADGGILVKATDMVSDAECNALSVTNDGKLALIPEDLISDVMGGNPLGINPDDCKLYINPCLLPGPQNIVSKDEDNLIVEDPEDCSALLKYQNVVSSDAGNLIEPGSDGKLSVTFQDIVDKQYFGAGLVYVERQDGSKVLQVAACNGLTFNEGDKTDIRGNTYHAKWLTLDLDDNQNLLYFVAGDGCTECFEGCGQLSIEFSLNASGEKLRILDRSGNVYKQINLSNGLQGDGSGGLTINTQDTIATTSPNDDKPISSKAVTAYAAPKYHANADKTIYGGGTGTLYGHNKLYDGIDGGDDGNGNPLDAGDSVAATPKAIKTLKDLIDDKAPKYHANADKTIYGGGTGTLYGHVKLTDSLTDGTNCKDSSVALSACAGKALKDMIDAIDLSQYAPIPHDDSTKKYGGGTSNNYGHVKLTDALDSTDCADSSVGLSACAGKQLKDLIDDLSGGGGGFLGEPLIVKSFGSNSDGVYANLYTPNVSGFDYYILEPFWAGASPLYRTVEAFRLYTYQPFAKNTNVSNLLGEAVSGHGTKALWLMPTLANDENDPNYRFVSFIYGGDANVLNYWEDTNNDLGQNGSADGYRETGFYDAPTASMHGYTGLQNTFHNPTAAEYAQIASILSSICGSSGVPVDTFAGSLKQNFPQEFASIKAIIESSKQRRNASVLDIKFSAGCVLSGPDNNHIEILIKAADPTLHTLRCLPVPVISKTAYPSSW